MNHTIGIDASLTALGLCAIPEEFGVSDWHRVFARTVITKPGGEDADRYLHLAKAVASFCAAYNADSVWIEDLPRGIRSSSVFRLAELAGVIKTEVRRQLGIPVTPVNPSSARKLLLGNLPAKGFSKLVVYEAFRHLGAHFEDDAQSDAACIAFYGRSECGLWTICAS